MAVMMAQILIGNRHSFEIGINPEYTIYYSENDKPALILSKEDIYDRSEVIEFDQKVWIPTIENTLEDALLMIGIYLEEDEELIKLADKYFTEYEDKKIVYLYDDIEQSDLEKLYEINRNKRKEYKLVISEFNPNAERFFDYSILKDFDMDITLARVDYFKEKNVNMSKGIEERGEL